MSHRLRAAGLTALVALTLSASAATAQTTLLSSMSVTCAPGIPGCGALRFFLSAGPNALALNSLRLTLLSPGWIFTTAGGAFGTYNAQDRFGPFGGFTTIGGGGTVLDIDFTENGFPFELWADETGFVDVEASGGTSTQNLYFSYSGVDQSGAIIAGTVTPEPVTLLLVGSGLAGIGAVARRRRRRNALLTD